MFQLPVVIININSGGGGLSNALVLSTAKQLLLDPPYYVYSAFVMAMVPPWNLVDRCHSSIQV